MDPSENPPEADPQDQSGQQEQESKKQSSSMPKPSMGQVKNLIKGGSPMQSLNPQGLGEMTNLSKGGVAKAAQLLRAAPVLLNPTVLMGIGIGIIVLIVVVFLLGIFSDDPENENIGEGTITITTQNTQVKNVSIGDNSQQTSAEQEVQGASTTADKAVLGLFDGAIDFLKKTANELRDLGEKHKDSLVTYTITASYTGAAREIEVIYPIPENAMLINASGTYTTTKGTDPTTGVEKITQLRWLFSQNNGSIQPSTTPGATKTQGVSFIRYTQAPYFLPSPSGNSDIQYSQNTIDALNKLGGAVSQNSSYLQSKFAAQYVDPFLSVIWVGAIEGIGDQPYFWNCKDQTYDINAGCVGGYTSGRWQVGYGIQVAQVGSHLASDFDSIYGAGSSGNASKVAEIGQAVIAGSGGKIRNPTTFPQETIPSLVSKANAGNAAAQQAIAILIMDQKLGATAIALEIAGDISSQNNWTQSMRGWSPYYNTENIQKFSNRAKALADTYTGVDGGGGAFGSKSFTVTLLPLVRNEPLESGVATMNVDEIAGGSTSGIGSTTTTSGGGYVAPSTDTCGGKYSLTSNPAGKNYGDPTCGYDKNKLYDLLKKLDPQNADLWFNKVIPCESAYNPNEFYRTGAAGDTPDPYGAWGLYQMGRGAEGPFTNLSVGSTNNPSRPEDRGDVNWEVQTSNAVNFNIKYLIPNGLPLGAYWQCAR